MGRARVLGSIHAVPEPGNFFLARELGAHHGQRGRIAGQAERQRLVVGERVRDELGQADGVEE